MEDKKKKIASARARKVVQREKSKGITGKEIRVAQGNVADDFAGMMHFLTNPGYYMDKRNDSKKLYRKN
jgi:hypothetical protein